MHSETMTLQARLLLKFCRKPDTKDYPMGGVNYESGEELSRLIELFPNFRNEIAGKVVIDLGSGYGYQSIACAQEGAKSVIGVEASENSLNVAAVRLAGIPELQGKVQFVSSIPDGIKADVIFSQNAFEHFLYPEEILTSMRAALAPKGKIFIGFGPPWNAPWGAHMNFFCRLPWVQLLFSERTVMEVRSLYRSDGSHTYREAGLGQISVGRFEQLVKSSGLYCLHSRYDYSKGLNCFSRTPLKELFVSYISCVLMQPEVTPPLLE